ncbi:MAG: nuclear transport factor 2 family protein [Eubacterium sp.]|nr:nuclear transport factor 2 family protein [Eubacterium sp.]
MEDWHGLAFTDFHSLIKEDGEWKILAKVFHQY